MNEVKSPKKPLIYYYCIVLIVLMLFNLLAMPWLSQRRIVEVDYGSFVSMVEDGEVKQAEIQEQENRVLFTKEGDNRIYKTAMVGDDRLPHRPSVLGSSHCDLCGHRPVYVTETDEKRRRPQRHDVWKIQRQNLCEIFGRH